MATDWKDFRGVAKRLDDIDLPKLGHLIGVGEDEMHAVLDVEAAGSGFDAKGRPKMLFEPHVFYRNLSGAKRNAAVKAGLAYAKWRKGYPKDSYPRLIKAMEIDETAALKASSWGLGQVLGENHLMLGYKTPQAMVLAFMADEENHLKGMVDFIVKAGIDDDLREHNWATFARMYNGPGYKENGYDTKLAKAYAKWSKIKDTPWSPDEVDQPVPVPTPRPETVVDKAVIENVQRSLVALGYTEVGGVDGKLGPLTSAAILAFRNDNGLHVSDVIDDELLLALQTAPARKLTPARTEATPAEVREKVPEVKANWLSKIGAFIIGIPSAVISLGIGALDYVGAAKAYIDPLKETAADVPGYVWVGAVAVIAGGLYYVAQRGEKKGVEAFKTGERR